MTLESEKKFYKIIVDNEQSMIETCAGNVNQWETIQCSENPGHQRPGKRITDLHIELKTDKIVDFSRTMLSDIVVTEKVLNVLLDYKICCYDKKEVNIKKSLTSIAGNLKLYELIVLGNGGDAHSSSGIFVKKFCSACGLERFSAYDHGITIDIDKWDGSDIFTIKGYPKYVFVSEMLKTIFENEKLTNIAFIDSTKLVWPTGVNKP